jgi:hypothetical protein
MLLAPYSFSSESPRFSTLLGSLLSGSVLASHLPRRAPAVTGILYSCISCWLFWTLQYNTRIHVNTHSSYMYRTCPITARLSNISACCKIYSLRLSNVGYFHSCHRLMSTFCHGQHDFG